MGKGAEGFPLDWIDIYEGMWELRGGFLDWIGLDGMGA